MTHPSKSLARLSAATAILLGALPAAQAAALYDNLGSTLDGADPVQSYGPLANSFSSGNDMLRLRGVQLMLKSDSDQLSGRLQLDLLFDAAGAPGAVGATLGTLDSSVLATQDFAAYAFGVPADVVLAANQRYWLRLATADVLAVEWSWSTDLTALGVAGEASYSQLLGVQPNSAAGPYQMRLDVSEMPEPDGMWLVLAAISAAGFSARRTRRPR